MCSLDDQWDSHGVSSGLIAGEKFLSIIVITSSLPIHTERRFFHWAMSSFSHHKNTIFDVERVVCIITVWDAQHHFLWTLALLPPASCRCLDLWVLSVVLFLAAVSIQSVAQVHTMRHELYFLKSSAHSSLELPLRYSIPSSVLLLFWTGICFLTFAVPFEETCVVFSNSFVRQIQHTARHSTTYSLISLHSGARDADMMKLFSDR